MANRPTARRIPTDCMIDRAALASLSDRAAYTLIRLDGRTKISTRGLDDVMDELGEFVHVNTKLGIMSAKRCAYSAEALAEDV